MPLSKNLTCMRQFVPCYLIVIGILGCPPSTCRSAERSLPVAEMPAGSRVCMDVPTLKSLVGVPYRKTTTQHFTILYEAGDDRAARTGETLERAYQSFYQVFSQAGFTLSRLPTSLRKSRSEPSR